MAIVTMTTASMPEGVKEYYDRRLLQHVEHDIVHAKLGQKAQIPAGHKSQEWRRYNRIPISATPANLHNDGGSIYTGSPAGYRLVEGKTPDTSLTLTVETITAQPEQYGALMEGSDLVDPLNIDPILRITTDRLGQHAAETHDIMTRNALLTGGAVQYAGSATSVDTITTGMTLTFAELIEALATLKTNRAKPASGGKWVAIISVATWARLMQDADFREAVVLGGKDNMFTGQLGSFLGITFVESSLAYSQTNASAVEVHTTFLFGADAFGILNWAGMNLRTIYTPPGGHTDPYEQRWKMTWKSNFAVAILNSLYYVQIKHAV